MVTVAVTLRVWRIGALLALQVRLALPLTMRVRQVRCWPLARCRPRLECVVVVVRRDFITRCVLVVRVIIGLVVVVLSLDIVLLVDIGASWELVICAGAAVAASPIKAAAVKMRFIMNIFLHGRLGRNFKAFGKAMRLHQDDFYSSTENPGGIPRQAVFEPQLVPVYVDEVGLDQRAQW